MSLLIEQRPDYVPLTRACAALSMNRSSVYLRRCPRADDPLIRAEKRSRKSSAQPRALSAQEREDTLKVLNSEEFIDQTPAEIYHSLLERGEYLCSLSTMYRLFREHKQSGDRRQQRSPQSHAIPRLFADQPNKVWTWDCSKLSTVIAGVYLTLYVVLDLYSRYVLAWMVSRKENSALAMQLMEEATARYGISPGQLTIHQDRGSPMIAHRYIDVLLDLNVTLSHSRPRVSNDNPFSESQFKTMKYQPDYPSRFDNAAHARRWCDEYFHWYNYSHHHDGLNGYTPEQVFTSRYHEVAPVKQQALDQRYTQNPERFVHGRPTIAMPPSQVYINRVSPEDIVIGATDLVNFPTLNRVKDKLAKSTLSL